MFAMGFRWVSGGDVVLIGMSIPGFVSFFFWKQWVAATAMTKKKKNNTTID